MVISPAYSVLVSLSMSQACVMHHLRRPVSVLMGQRKHPPNLMCFFKKRGSTEGTNSLKILCFNVCVCFVLCKFVSGPIFFVVVENLWFDDLCA